MPKIKTLKALQSKKKNLASKDIHPKSRRAKQLERIGLRTRKLARDKKERKAVGEEWVNRLVFAIRSLPEDGTPLTLPQLHSVILSYLSRNDDELQELERERVARSKWRAEPKSKRELELEKEKEEEEAEYRSGFTLPDLTSPENVRLCQQWLSPVQDKYKTKDEEAVKVKRKKADPNAVHRLKLISLTSEKPEKVIVVQEGDGSFELGGNGSESEEGEDIIEEEE